jgi:pilus assembly protein CpaE
MTNLAFDVTPERDETAPRNAEARPIPRITIQAFCDTPEIAGTIETASSDRRMARAHVKVHTGGLTAAAEFYRTAPTPNLIIVETRLPFDELIGTLDSLAEVCDAGTKVLVIGHTNDVRLYRELLKRGVSEYLVAPVDVMSIISGISNVYRDPANEKLGQAYAFIGAKGGVGSSTIAHNVAWTMARLIGSDVILADLDMAFGTAGLDFNLDPPQGIAEAVFGADRLDEVLLDRLLAKCEDHLSLLAAPAALDRAYDFDEAAFDQVLEIVQQNVPTVVLDMPHTWTAWARKTLIAVDEVVITATPDLANLRNAKAIVDFLRQARPNDAPPKLILNQVGVPKRPEIKPDDFAAALQVTPIATIPFDPLLFGTASNNGQMVAEASAKTAVSDAFAEIAQVVAGRKELKKARKRGFELGSIFEKLKSKPAAKSKAKKAS